MEPSPHRPRGRLGLGLVVAAVVVVVDQATKVLAERVLEPARFVAWLSDDIGWELVYNPGAAFGLPVPSWLFPVIGVVVVVLVVATLVRTSRHLPVTGYALLLAGAVGNMVDRVLRAGDPGDPSLLHGHVVDFIAWGAFPRFNVADIAINVGIALLALDLLRGHSDTAPDPTAHHQERLLHDLGADQSPASGTVRVIGADGADGADGPR